MFETSCYIQGISEIGILLLICRQRRREGETAFPLRVYLRIKYKMHKNIKNKTRTKQLKEWISLAGLENFRLVWRSRTAARSSKTSVNLYQSTVTTYPKKVILSYDGVTHWLRRWFWHLSGCHSVRTALQRSPAFCLIQKAAPENGSTTDFINRLLQIRGLEL